MSRLIVRKILPEDEPKIRDFILFIQSDLNPEDIEDEITEFKSHPGLICLENDNCRGILIYSIDNNIGQIIRLYVSWENQGENIAAVLLTRLERELRKKYILTIISHTRPESVISEVDIFLRQFYRSHGFGDKQIIPNYYPDASDGLKLEKKLI